MSLFLKKDWLLLHPAENMWKVNARDAWGNGWQFSGFQDMEQKSRAHFSLSNIKYCPNTKNRMSNMIFMTHSKNWFQNIMINTKNSNIFLFQPIFIFIFYSVLIGWHKRISWFHMLIIFCDYCCIFLHGKYAAIIAPDKSSTKIAYPYTFEMHCIMISLKQREILLETFSQ